MNTPRHGLKFFASNIDFGKVTLTERINQTVSELMRQRELTEKNMSGNETSAKNDNTTTNLTN